MTVSSAYQHLVAGHETLLGSVTERVKETVAMERLYLLGLTHTQHRTETLFAAAGAAQNEATHCWLLAVVSEGGPGLHNLPDKLETGLLPLVLSTVIVLSAADFRQWLTEGHPFAAAVYGSGYLLHQEPGLVLPTPAEVDEVHRQKENALLLTQTRQRVREFLAGAELYSVRLQYGLAAFLLHQAAEQALRTMLILHTGFRLNTHSLDRLLRCCALFYSASLALFPRRSEKDKRLFALLQKAYVNARYKEDYRIKREELKALTEKVRLLQALFERCGTPEAIL